MDDGDVDEASEEEKRSECTDEENDELLELPSCDSLRTAEIQEVVSECTGNKDC